MTYYDKIANNIPKADMITLIKCCALAYIAVIDILIGIFISHTLDKYIFSKSFSKNDKDKSIPRLIMEICLIVSTFTIIAYIVRNIIQLIPFPLDNKFGFDYSRVNEVKSGALLSATLILYCSTLYSKVVTLRNKLNGIQVQEKALY
jgi:hypothetical protein